MYTQRIFEDDTDGYIHLIQIREREAIKIYNTQISGLRDIVHEYADQEDFYISPNTYYRPQRQNDNIRQLRALFIDLDLNDDVYVGKNEAIWEMDRLAESGSIPPPSMVIDSGRGLHAYWIINNAPYGALQTWQELQDYLYYQLRHLGSDLKATDAARVLRLPGTVNSRNNAQCRIVVNEPHKYSMYDLRSSYIKGYDKKTAVQRKQLKSGSVARFFNSYTLHLARAEDILTLCRLRLYRVTGYRNFIIHCYAYWRGIYVRDCDSLAEIVLDLNGQFTDPLPDRDISTIVKSVLKAVDKFIEYEQGIRSGASKRISKGMRDKAGYWYKNETLINRLNITDEEQKHLKAIIGMKEKYARNNDRRNESRRNEAGFTAREQLKADRESEVRALIKSGMNKSDISKKIGIHRNTLSRYYGHLFIANIDAHPNGSL